jgi:AraC-like DNA-binding protein
MHSGRIVAVAPVSVLNEYDMACLAGRTDASRPATLRGMDLSTDVAQRQTAPAPLLASAPTTAPGIAPTHAALIAPRLSLASCVRSYLSRSTLRVDLSPQQQQNRFPASPLCCISWLLQGESTVIRRGDVAISEAVPVLSFIGPHTVPSISANPGPVEAFMVALLPQAVQALTGVDLAALVNRVVPLESVFDETWVRMALAVQRASDDAARVQLIEAFLEPRWLAVRQHALPRIDRQRHWVEALALRAAISGMGKSLRQMERRIKEWAGLPLRDLRRMARADASFSETRNAFDADTAKRAPNWAAVAADGGFSDQSHLCRETRRISGLSPNELKRAIEEQESFWIYRIWD